MKIRSIKEVNEFIKAIDSCKGNVYLTSVYGDKYNLKSKLSQYVGIAAMIGNHANDLELWCDDRQDETRFLKLFNDNPAILA